MFTIAPSVVFATAPLINVIEGLSRDFTAARLEEIAVAAGFESYRAARALLDPYDRFVIPFEPMPVPVLVDPITGEVVSVEERRDTRGIYYTPVIPCPSGKGTMAYAVGGPGGVKLGPRYVTRSTCERAVRASVDSARVAA